MPIWKRAGSLPTRIRECKPANPERPGQRTPRPLYLLLAGLLCFATASVEAAAGQASDTGTIRGQVQSLATGELLRGAAIRLEGTNRVVFTDGRGLFRLNRVPVGSQTVTVEYLGLEGQERRVDVNAGAEVVVNFDLETQFFQLAEISVEAQMGGQAAALNRQRIAQNIRNVVSRDALARVRDGQIGEALQALPGVYMSLEILSPTRPVVRGISREFNSVTVDGIRLDDVYGPRTGSTRYYPGEVVGEVEVIKAVTPDMEGDAIGGTVNLISRRAIDLPSREFRVGLGGSYNNIQSNFNRQFNVSFGDRFLDDGRLAVLFTGNAYEVNQGYPQVTTSYAVNDADQFRIQNMNVFERLEEGSRTVNWALITDYRLSDRSVLSFRGSLLRDARRLEDWRSTFNLGSVISFDEDNARYQGGRVDLFRQFRHPVSGTQVYGLRMEHELEDLTIDYRVAYALGTNSYDRTFFPFVRGNGVDFSYDRSIRDFPSLSIENGFDLNDPDNYEHFEIRRTQAPRRDREYSADFNLRRDFSDRSFSPYLKTGARVKYRRTNRGDQDAGYYNYSGDLPVSAFMREFPDQNFMPRSNGRILFPRINPSFEGEITYENLFFNRPDQFSRQDNRSDLLLANRVTDKTETIVASYLMGGFRAGRLDGLGGVRIEHTDFLGRANEVITEGGAIVALTPTRYDTRYTNILPGIHLNFRQSEDLLLRGSVNRTLARPDPRRMQPARTVNDDTQRITDGNPDLSVTSSTNFDLSLEYYIRPLGMASVGVFFKDIDGFYSSVTETVQDGPFAGYDLVRPSMGDGGQIYGVELSWQQRLNFLPAPFDDLGTMVNATFLSADGRYPNRPDEKLTFPQTSTRLFNANLYYARGALDARILYNWRDRYLTGVGSRPALDRYEDSRGTLDLLVSYRFMDRFSVNMDWKNITDSPIRAYQGSRENPTSIRYFDYSLIMGISVDF